MKIFQILYSKFLSKPKETKNTSTILVWVLWILRLFVLVQGCWQLLFGEKGSGIITLICFFVITLPKYVTKDRVKRFPIEIELILFLIVLIQYIIGEAQHFYTNVPNFDKFVHLTIPFLIAVINYSVFFTMYSIGRLKTSVFNVFLLVIFLTLGVGALWEIIEYGTDLFLVPFFHVNHHFQGSLTENPFYDTINDLVADLLGGILGAIFSTRFLLRSIKNGRTRELVNEISSQMFKNKSLK